MIKIKIIFCSPDRELQIFKILKNYLLKIKKKGYLSFFCINLIDVDYTITLHKNKLL